MKTELNRIAKDTNFFLKKFIDKQNNSKLIPAMNYGLFPGGKKIRSKVLIDIGSLLSTDYKTLIAIGAAVECIHAILLFMMIYHAWIMINLEEESHLHILSLESLRQCLLEIHYLQWHLKF